MNIWKDESITESKKRLQRLVDNWADYYNPKEILIDILKCWPEKEEKS